MKIVDKRPDTRDLTLGDLEVKDTFVFTDGSLIQPRIVLKKNPKSVTTFNFGELREWNFHVLDIRVQKIDITLIMEKYSGS